MATFQEIQDRVSAWLIDLPSAVQTQVPALVNKAHKAIQKRHNFKVMEAEASFTTDMGERALTTPVPTDLKEWRDEGWILHDDGGTDEVVWAPNKTAMRRYFSEDDEGMPEFLFDPVSVDEDGVRTLHVWPLPDGNSDHDDGEYDITVPYYKFLPDLSGSDDTDWFTDNADWYLTYKALAEGFAMDWDEQFAIWEQKAEAEYKEIVKQDKQLRLGGMRELVFHWRGAKAPFTRR